MAVTLRDRIRDTAAPKKILALDGGGVRGLITIEVLTHLEGLLRHEFERGDDFVLADYFDYVAGTSTGAIIATGIAMGMSMEAIRGFYLDNSQHMFDRATLLKRFRLEVVDDQFSARLQTQFGIDTTLGSERLRCLLMLVLRNAVTDMPWTVTNHPEAKYNRRSLPDGSVREDCNLDLPLWRLIRASAATPAYFPPEEVRLGSRRFAFMDGERTPYNNPALLAFLMATMEPYHLCWPTGEDRLLLVSVGNGCVIRSNESLEARDMHLLAQSSHVPLALAFGAHMQQDILCRVMGKCLAGDPLNREMGDLIGNNVPLPNKLFTYLRYDADISRQGLDYLGLQDVDQEHVQISDTVDYLPEILRIGQALAQLKVHSEHFAAFPA